MSELLEPVAAELRDIGLNPKIVNFPGVGWSPQGIVIDVAVQTGKYKGQVIKVGISFQENSYPEYPPHFVHLKASVKTTNITRHSEHKFANEEWYAYSLPPSDFWDGLDQSQKNMKTYYHRHLQKILDKL
ncbi:MAG: hypothetical protein OXG88_07515 [Gammaproteobacteria bacterium]|nr:hypothetical protein [Gammaproteobacteria bacterium]